MNYRHNKELFLKFESNDIIFSYAKDFSHTDKICNFFYYVSVDTQVYQSINNDEILLGIFSKKILAEIYCNFIEFLISDHPNIANVIRQKNKCSAIKEFICLCKKWINSDFEEYSAILFDIREKAEDIEEMIYVYNQSKQIDFSIESIIALICDLINDRFGYLDNDTFNNTVRIIFPEEVDKIIYSIALDSIEKFKSGKYLFLL